MEKIAALLTRISMRPNSALTAEISDSTEEGLATSVSTASARPPAERTSPATAWPVAARAQQPAMPVIGYLSGRSPDAEGPLRTPLLAALEEAGFVVGRNVAIEYRFAE